MYNLYETLPFGVLVVNMEQLKIKYANNLLLNQLNLSREIIGLSIKDIDIFNSFVDSIIESSKLSHAIHLNEIELIENKFYNIIISSNQNEGYVYLYDITESIIENRKFIENNELKMKKEREKFLSISTELKTKCDIIEILRAREKEHLMHLKDVINNISEGLIVIDNKGKFNICNRAAHSITGLNIGEFINMLSITKKYYAFNADNLSENMEEVFDKCLKENIQIKNLVTKLIDKSENNVKYVEINSNPIFSKNNQIIYTIVTLKDVTEARLHQIYAEEQAKFVKDVVNTLDVPIAVIDYPNLNYLLVNENHSKILLDLCGMDRKIDSLIGLNIIDVLKNHIGENFPKILKRVGDTGKEYTFSPFCIRDENDNERFYKVKIEPYKDIQGKVARIHIHGLDITEEVNHSMELEKVTKLKDEFFTVISHELRTPLTIIYSSLQLANNIYKSEITPNIDKTLSRIDQNCSRLLKLINNTLDLSKAEAGFLVLNPTQFNIVYTSEFIVNSVNLYAKSKGIELIFDTNEEEAEVSLDKEKYEKILLNLLSNAIKFTPEGKQILVTLTIEEGYVSLSVKDQGIGIPDNKIDYIFDRFAQVNTSLSRRAEGTGIGLSLVKKFTELMDGDIKVNSMEGQGTEFTVTFNKVCADTDFKNYAMIDTSMRDKINIEFSDIN